MKELPNAKPMTDREYLLNASGVIECLPATLTLDEKLVCIKTAANLLENKILMGTQLALTGAYLSNVDK